MGWFGKVVGGVIGFAAGGPVGAAIGVGLGHGVDKLTEDSGGGTAAGLPTAVGATELVVDGQFADDEVGRLCTFHVRTPVPQGSQGVIQVVDSFGNTLEGRPPFRTQTGEFFASVPILDGQCRIFLPFGAIEYPAAESYGLMFAALHPAPGGHDFTNLGAVAFQTQLPEPRRFSKVEWLGPLIDLCMAVVHADGKVLPEEVRHVKTYFAEVFELDRGELAVLKAAMKGGPPPSLEHTVESVAFRLPALSVAETLAVLADVSACDGEIHPAEIEVIRRVALIAGVPASEWETLARELGLGGGPAGARSARGGMSRDRACAVLGLQTGASRAEVLAAYRKLATDYHPDRVSNLPEEFKQVAHDKMVEINAAYDTLKRT
jgi:DnaJ like chaperone protein